MKNESLWREGAEVAQSDCGTCRMTGRANRKLGGFFFTTDLSVWWPTAACRHSEVAVGTLCSAPPPSPAAAGLTPDLHSSSCRGQRLLWRAPGWCGLPAPQAWALGQWEGLEVWSCWGTLGPGRPKRPCLDPGRAGAEAQLTGPPPGWPPCPPCLPAPPTGSWSCVQTGARGSAGTWVESGSWPPGPGESTGSACWSAGCVPPLVVCVSPAWLRRPAAAAGYEPLAGPRHQALVPAELWRRVEGSCSREVGRASCRGRG